MERLGVYTYGVAVATASTEVKQSFHVVFQCSHLFHNAPSFGVFIKSKVLPTVDEPIRSCIDASVYTTDRCFRFINQSKRKVGAVVLRPATVAGVDALPGGYRLDAFSFVIGRYIDDDRQVLPTMIAEKPAVAPRPVVLGDTITKATADLPTGYLGELCNLIPDSILDNNDTCYKFICAVWNTMPTAEGKALIRAHYDRVPHKKDMGADEYIDSVIARSRPALTIGTLVYWANENDRKAVRELYKKHNQHAKDVAEVVRPKTEIATIQYSERFVKPLNFNEVDTIVLASHLGTGKTTQAVNLMRPRRNVGLFGEYIGEPVYPFKRMIIISARKTFTRFVMGDLEKEGIGFVSYQDAKGCMSKFPRLVIQVESLWKLEDAFQPYDFVIIDESETVLNQLFSEKTNRHNMIRNHVMFERIVASGRKVLYADAFISARTLTNAETLRNPLRTHYVINDFCPYVRSATQLIGQHTQKNGEVVNVPALGEFCKRIMEDLKANKRVVVLWSSLRKVKGFVEEFLKNQPYKYRFYSSESTLDEQRELENVETAWAGLDLLMMTTTITVGINYNPTDDALLYDCIYLYGCAATALPRDIAQCLMRCRRVRSNQLIYTLDEKVFDYPLSGHEAIRADLENKRHRNTTEHPLIQWTAAPKWAEENYIHNSQEVASKVYGYNAVLTQYLQKSGYTITTETFKDDGMTLSTCGKNFEDIQEIDAEEAEDIKKREKRDMATPDEKIALYKYRFCSNLSAEGLENAAAIWNKVIMVRESEAKFWNIVNEKHQTVDDVMKFEAAGRFVNMTSRKADRRVVLAKVLDVLGMKHSCEGKKINAADVVEPLKALENEVIRAFGKESSSHRKGEFSQSNAIDLIKIVFTKWCGADVKNTSKRKQVDGKRTYFNTVEINSQCLYNAITSRRTDEVE